MFSVTDVFEIGTNVVCVCVCGCLRLSCSFLRIFKLWFVCVGIRRQCGSFPVQGWSNKNKTGGTLRDAAGTTATFSRGLHRSTELLFKEKSALCYICLICCTINNLTGCQEYDIFLDHQLSYHILRLEYAVHFKYLFSYPVSV